MTIRTDKFNYLSSSTETDLKILENFYRESFPRSADIRMAVIDGWMSGHSSAEIARDLKKHYCTIRSYLHDAERHLKAIRHGSMTRDETVINI